MRTFLKGKLCMTTERAAELVFTFKPLTTGGRKGIDNQVLVTFSSVGDRDEVPALAINLASDREAGLQLEPPDHLRSHYLTFQSLAYNLKTKNLSLKRNIKFCDSDMSLEMDYTIGDGWRTIGYEDAKHTLKSVKNKSSKRTRQELATLLTDAPSANGTCLSDSDSDEGTMVEVSDDEDGGDNNDKNDNKNMESYSVSKLSVILANARSLAPKLESLSDHLHESKVQLALLTETWLQDGKSLEDLSTELEHGYSLSMLTRNRTYAANNGGLYGGVALIYRSVTGKFENFPFNNPDDHEILATVGRVYGIKSKLFTLTAHITLHLHLYEDCLVIVGGDFNQWPV